MASVLSTGADPHLMATRALVMEKAGHRVVTALGDSEVLAACQQNRFDVAVIGQVMRRQEKQRLLRVIRENAPNSKVLELYNTVTGKILPDADGWLEVPATIPNELASTVSALAVRG